MCCSHETRLMVRARIHGAGLCHWKQGDSNWVWFTLAKLLSNEVWDGNRAAFRRQRGSNPLGRSIDTCNWNKSSYKLTRLIWKPRHLKHRHLSALFWAPLQVLLPQLLTPQACVAQPHNRNACVLCYSTLSRRDSCKKHCLQGDWGASLIFPLVPAGHSKELLTEQGHRPHRGYSQGCMWKIAGATLFSLHLSTPKTHRAATLKGLIHPLQYFW